MVLTFPKSLSLPRFPRVTSWVPGLLVPSPGGPFPPFSRPWSCDLVSEATSSARERHKGFPRERLCFLCCRSRDALGLEVTDPNPLPRLLTLISLWLNISHQAATVQNVRPPSGQGRHGPCAQWFPVIPQVRKNCPLLLGPQRDLGSSSGHAQESAPKGRLVASPVSLGQYRGGGWVPVTGEPAKAQPQEPVTPFFSTIPPASGSSGADSGQVSFPSLRGHPCDLLGRGTWKASSRS